MSEEKNILKWSAPEIDIDAVWEKAPWWCDRIMYSLAAKNGYVITTYLEDGDISTVGSALFTGTDVRDVEVSFRVCLSRPKHLVFSDEYKNSKVREIFLQPEFWSYLHESIKYCGLTWDGEIFFTAVEPVVDKEHDRVHYTVPKDPDTPRGLIYDVAGDQLEPIGHHWPTANKMTIMFSDLKNFLNKNHLPSINEGFRGTVVVGRHEVDFSK